MAIGLAGLTAVPGAAVDRFPSSGPLEIRIFGANGVMRDFVAQSAMDRRGALALVNQIGGAVEGPAQPIEESAVMLPHYRVDVSHLGPAYVTAPWARVLETSFIYFPGGQDNSFMVVEFTNGHAALEQRWILPDPDVGALLDRHLEGLTAIGLKPPLLATATAPWNAALGFVVLVAIGLRLFAERPRARRTRKKGALAKGINQRSSRSTAAKLASP